MQKTKKTKLNTIKKYNAIQNILKLSEDVSVEFRSEIVSILKKYTEAIKKIETPIKPKKIDKKRIIDY